MLREKLAEKPDKPTDADDQLFDVISGGKDTASVVRFWNVSIGLGLVWLGWVWLCWVRFGKARWDGVWLSQVGIGQIEPIISCGKDTGSLDSFELGYVTLGLIALGWIISFRDGLGWDGLGHLWREGYSISHQVLESECKC